MFVSLLAFVIPILKSGAASSVANYRPISLTSTCGKLLEHIVAAHIRPFLSEHRLLDDKQHGFRRGLSTTTQLVEVVHNFAEVLNRRGQVDVIFLDFQKAFDKVNHRKLLTKLQLMLKNPKLTTWIKSFLSGRTQFVDIKGKRSNMCEVRDRGSLRGPCLGPCSS